MSQLTTSTLAAQDLPLWDRYVEHHPAGTIFQTSAWLSRVCDEVDVRVVLDGGGRIVGGCALGLSWKYGFKGYHIPPYTPYVGPLFSPSRKTQRSCSRTEEQRVLDLLLCSLPRRSHYDFKLPPGAFDLYPYIRQGFTSFVQYTHELSGSRHDYRRHMGRRKAFLHKMQQMLEHGEITLTLGADAEEILQSLRGTAKQRGFDPKDDLLRRLVADPVLAPGWTAIAIHSRDRRLLAGSLLLADARRVYYLVNTVPAEKRPEWQHVNLLSVDAAIGRALDQGKIFDFEGSMLPGVEEFYRRLGAVATPTYRLQRSRSLTLFALRSIRQYFRERGSWMAGRPPSPDPAHGLRGDEIDELPRARPSASPELVASQPVAAAAQRRSDSPLGV